MLYAFAHTVEGEIPSCVPKGCEASAAEFLDVFLSLGVVNPENTANEICRQAQKAMAYIERNPDATMSVSKYDNVRKQILKRFELESTRGTLLWPPTSQTIISRLGGKWSTAMEYCGLSASTDGSLGSKNARFTDEDRMNALRSYLGECEDKKQNPSYMGYTNWAKERGGVPSGATMRQSYGTWQNALNLAKKD